MQNDTIYRVLLGSVAVLMAANGLSFWFATDAISPAYGLAQVTDALGHASIRTDVAGYFIVLAALASYAAYNRNSTAALIGAGMFLVAMTGRLISMGFDGVPPHGILPLVVEVLSATILLLAARKWATSTRTDTGANLHQSAMR